MVDHVLSESMGDLCCCLVFAGEGCNQVIRRILHGQMSPDLQRKVQTLKFFSKLEHQPLPLEWPRLPVQTCTLDDQAFFGVIGPAHTMKNSAGQLQSHIRTLYFGMFFADLAGTLPHGIPWPAFQRQDAMSDRLCSLLCGPQFLISPMASWI